MNTTGHTPLDEKHLLELIAAGNEQAFRVLFDRYFDLVYSTALRFTAIRQLAEDATQEIFSKIWEKRAGLASIRELQPYLFTAAKREILQHFRKEAHQRDYVSHVIEVFGEAGERDPESLLISQQQVELLQTVIAQLPDRQREAFLLSRDEKLSYADIAIRMGISRETVKEYIAQVLKKLRAYTNEHPDLLLVVIAFLFP